MSSVVGYRVDEILGHEYDSFRPGVNAAVSAGLASARINVPAPELDAFYNQAWFGVYARSHAGEPVGIHEGLLSEIAERRAIDEYRTANPDKRLDSAVLEAVGIADPIEETVEQQEALREFSESMRSKFTQWELQAATLNYVFGFTLHEAAQKVGVNPVRLAAVMVELTPALDEALKAIDADDACADRASLINQFGFGVFGPRSDEYRDAVNHLNGCDGCRRHVLGARAITAVTISSRAIVVALTGALPAGAPIAASPLRTAPGPERRSLPPITPARSSKRGPRKGVVIAAIAAMLFGGYVISHQLAHGPGSAIDAGLTKIQTASAAQAEQAAKARAAKERREDRAAEKRRAERRDRARARARDRARARSRARARAAARRRSQAAQKNVATTAPAQTQLPAQAAPQVQQQVPASQPKPQPAPSTDPTQEFDVK